LNHIDKDCKVNI